MHPREQDTKIQTMVKVDADEHLIATIHRHPIGIIMIYFQVAVGLVAAFALTFFLIPNFVDTETVNVYGWVSTVFIGIAVIMAVVMSLATVIYRVSKLIVSDKNITQVIQEGLFNRKISQLAISNIEDVTANRSGVLQTLINYGQLNIETAGEQMNFHFFYCPRPDHYAKLILEARQKYMEQYSSHISPHNSTQQVQSQFMNAPQQQAYYQQPPQNVMPQYYQQQQPTNNSYAQPYAANPPQAQQPYAPVPPPQPYQSSAPLPAEQPPAPIPGTDYRGPA